MQNVRLKFHAVVFFTVGLAFCSELLAVPTGSTTTTGRTLKGSTPGCGSCHAADAGVSVAIQGPSTLFPGQAASYTVSATKTPNTSTVPSPWRLGLNAASSDNGLSAGTDTQLVGTEITHLTAKSIPGPTTSGSFQFNYTMPASAAAGSPHELFAVAALGLPRSGFNHAMPFVITALAPSKPTALIVQSVTSTSLGLSWSGTAPEFRAIYKVGSAPSSPLDGTLIREGTGTTATATALTPNTRYYVAVYGKAGAIYSAGPATSSVVTSSNSQIASAGKWENRQTSTSRGKILFSDDVGNLKLYDGTNVITVQPNASANTVWVLGSGAAAGQVIGGWRSGTDFAYLSVDGGTPVLINAANPINPGVAMNAEDIKIDAGCVFALFRAPTGGSERRNVFTVNPATGNATNISNYTTFFGASNVSSSGCKAAWTLYQADTASGVDGTALSLLQYYNGASVTQIDNFVIGNPIISQGRIVYIKNLGTAANRRGEVFLFDTTATGAVPVQLTSDVTKNNDKPDTDGRHVAWVRRNADGTSPEIVLYGGIQLTSGNMTPIDSTAFPFQLDRGQILWKDTAGALRYLTAAGSSTVDTSPAPSYTHPWLTDGFVAFLGGSIDAVTPTAPVFRFTGVPPSDATQPAAPLLVTATAAASQVTVNWDRIAGASSYNVYYAEQPGVTPANFATLAGGKRITAVASPPFTLALTANKSYTFVVTTVEGTTEGPPSRPASATLVGALNWMSVANQPTFNFFVAAADQSNANVAYASRQTAGFTGETFKSTDGGITWTQLAGGIGGVYVRALAVDGARLFATSPSGSILRSMDSGATWTTLFTGAGVGESTQSIAIDPMVPNTILAGDFQLPGFSGVTDAIVIRSDDGGGSWSHLPQGPALGDDIRAYSIAFDPARSTTVYAGGSGTPNVAKSISSGAGWTNVGLPTSAAIMGTISALAIDPTNSSTIYGSTINFRHAGVFKSTNGGTTWTPVNTGLPTSGSPAVPPSINAMVMDPLDPNVLHLGTEVGYFYSTNGGASWTSANTGLPNSSAQFIYSLAITPGHRVIAGTGAGLYLLNFNPPPTITAVSPNSGNVSGGTAVTITGTGFQSPATVSIGGVAATSVVVVNSTTITATTPAHAAGAVDVVVTNFDSRSSTLSAGFTYATTPPPPTVSSVNPSSGPAGGGTAVTITGTNFAAGATVTIGGTNASVLTLTATTITATTPAHAAGAGDVVVRNADTQSATLAAGFTFVAAPTVAAISPVSGPAAGGTVVTITGNNFAAGATVTIGGTNATVATVTATTITATTPARAAGAADVVVRNSGGQSATLAAGFTYVSGATGDANGDAQVTVSDVFYLINHLLAGGPGPIGSGDANGDGTVTVGDIFYLINFLLAGGPPPN